VVVGEVSDDLRPRRAVSREVTDEGAACVYGLLSEVAARITRATGKEPAIRPPAGGMTRLGNRDRASFVWFIPCHEKADFGPGRTRPEACNHGLGVDRQYGQYEVRAWAHGAPGVHDVSLHTREVTVELLEAAAKLVGIPLAPTYLGALDAECPVCLVDHPHDGVQLEKHKTPEGHPCLGSGWKLQGSVTA
jgi:hypothetical protein